MAYMQMCRPNCEASYSETENLKFSNDSQGCYSSDYKHQEHKSAGHSMSHSGHHNMGSLLHKHPSHNHHGTQGSHPSEHKHHEYNSGGYPMNHSTGHHGLTEKITGFFSHTGSSHHGPHHASCECTEKMEEHMTYKSGYKKSAVHIKKKSSYKSNCRDGNDSSDDESDNEGCIERC